MEKWTCIVCGYVYDEAVGDPDSGIAPGTKFEDLPDDWVCPVCGVSKDQFEKAYEKHKEMGCICFENEAMGIYFIVDPDGYWLEILP